MKTNSKIVNYPSNNPFKPLIAIPEHCVNFRLYNYIH